MKDNKHIQSFNEHQENSNTSDIVKSLLILKGRIQELQLDINKIDTETAVGRLKAMHFQVERLLDSYSSDKNLEKTKDRGSCPECGEGYDNEEEWLYNTECELCGHPIPENLIVKRP